MQILVEDRLDGALEWKDLNFVMDRGGIDYSALLRMSWLAAYFDVAAVTLGQCKMSACSKF